MSWNLGRMGVFLTVISVLHVAPSSSLTFLRPTIPRRDLISVRVLDDLDENKCVGGAELESARPDILPICVNDVQKRHIPKEFDSRVKWPFCSSVFEITDQGECASSWAVAVTSSLTDRYCIAARGEDSFDFSAQDLLTCGANAAGWNSWNGIKGCQGGNVVKAFKYVQEKGVVSGGSYRPGPRQGYGCQSYEFPPCDHTHDHGFTHCHTSIHAVDTPTCQRRCQANFGVHYPNDIKTLPVVCNVQPIVEEIQTEIMKNGPVVAVMKLWSSFLDYNTTEIYEVEGGIYNRVLMCHAVKIIGWGLETKEGKDVPYWLVANSWGHQWGLNGFFKIAQGVSKGAGAWIETLVTAGRFN